MKAIFQYPSKNLVISIPVILILGFITGLFINTSFLKDYILVFTFFMIFPTMIGFKIRDAINLTHLNVVLVSSILNFIIIPLTAYIVGLMLLKNQPEIFAGFIMISLFPTSGMTISWTMLSNGNVAAAIKVTTISLIIGSFLAPLYLWGIVGTLIEINLIKTFVTIIQIVILPMLLGSITYSLLIRRYSKESFNKKIKPMLPPISVWAMLFIIFSSISMKSQAILKNPKIILSSVLILVLFYFLNFLISTIVSRKIFKKEDGYALIYGTVMRNLSIALGIAISSFGPETALIITLAFILQVQSAAWYGKLSARFNWLTHRSSSPSLIKTNE